MTTRQHSPSDAPSWVWLLGLPGVLLLNIVASRPATFQIDIWHQMALAREAIKAGYLPDIDLFSYAPTVYPSIQHEWGAGVVALAVSQWGGGNALALLNCAVSLATVGFLVLALRREQTPITVILTTLLVGRTIGISSFVPMLAQAYSCLLFAVLMYFLRLDRHGKRWWIAIWFVAFVGWVNLHGGFVVGFLVIAAVALERALKGQAWGHLVGVAVGMAALIAVNPYGPRLYAYMFDALSIRRPIITEWDPHWLIKEPTLVHAGFVLSLVVFASLVWRLGWRRIEGVLLTVVLAALSVRVMKLLPFYAAAWVLTVSPALRLTPGGARLGSIWRTERGTFLVAATSVSLCAVVLLAVSTPWKALVPGSPGRSIFGTIYPVGPVEYLRQHAPRANIMTPFMTGAFVSWKLGPDVKVGCDSRYEVAYPPQYVERVVSLYFDARDAEWNDLVQSAPTDLVLAERDSALAGRLRREPGWQLSYTDDAFVLYARERLSLPVEDRTREQIWGTLP